MSIQIITKKLVQIGVIGAISVCILTVAPTISEEHSSKTSFVRPRISKQSPQKIKEKIAQTLEDGLTLLTDLIAFSAHTQKVFVTEFRRLIDEQTEQVEQDGLDECVNFFSRATVKELEMFQKELERETHKRRAMQDTLEALQKDLKAKYKTKKFN